MIDEAIAHEREVAEIYRNNDKLNKTLGKSSPYYNTDCIKCAEEHEQLAEWLEELKSYKRNTDICPICDTYCSYLSEEFENGYNKAIDDFAKLVETWCWKHEQYNQDDLNKLMDIAEQLKAGEAELQEKNCVKCVLNIQ